MRGGWVLSAVLVVIGLIPVLSITAASVIGAVGNCRVHDGYAETCLIGGRDWGGALALLDSIGWFFFLTAPIALAGFVLGIVLALLSLLHRARE